MSDKEKSTSKNGLLKFVCEKTGITGDELAGEATLELRGRNFLLIGGCKRIEKYSPCLMVMRVRGDILSIRGEGLACSSFHCGNVSVEGRIDAIEFGGGKEE